MNTTHNYILDFEHDYQTQEILSYLTEGYGDDGVCWVSELGDEHTMSIKISHPEFMPSHFKEWCENHYVNFVSESITKGK